MPGCCFSTNLQTSTNLRTSANLQNTHSINLRSSANIYGGLYLYVKYQKTIWSLFLFSPQIYEIFIADIRIFFLKQHPALAMHQNPLTFEGQTFQCQSCNSGLSSVDPAFTKSKKDCQYYYYYCHVYLHKLSKSGTGKWVRNKNMIMRNNGRWKIKAVRSLGSWTVGASLSIIQTSMYILNYP